MDKIKITQEQADAIEWVMKFSDKSSTVEEHIEYKLEESGWKLDDLKPLNELTTDYLIRALYIGYEVEPEPFTVGDWVVAKEYRIGKIIDITNNGEIIHIDYPFKDSLSGHANYMKRDIRHANPSEIAEEKERRWWGSNNRDVWELKKGDILEIDGLVDVFSHIEVTTAYFTDYRHAKFDWLKDNAKIICFKEDRLDVKENE